MHITYDPQADVLAIRLREAEPGPGLEVAPDLFVERDGRGDILGWELLNASKHVQGSPTELHLELLTEAVASAT